mgnify:CR=1 FL=1
MAERPRLDGRLDDPAWADCLPLTLTSPDLPALALIPSERNLVGAEMCMPGDNITMKVNLITPVAVEQGQRFAIREGGRTVGAGAVTKILK